MFSKEEVRDGRPIRRDQPDEKGSTTMKLTVNMNVSVDGVTMQVYRTAGRSQYG